MTRNQLALIHIAKGKVGLNDPQYRMLLKSVAGVDSSKLLDNSQFEDVMAVLEDMGFGRTTASNSSYWRNIVENRGVRVGARMVHKIRELAATEAGRRYTLAAMVSRFSDKRTEDVEQLYPREAWKLIEGYKAINSREAGEQQPGRQTMISDDNLKPISSADLLASPGHALTKADLENAVDHVLNSSFLAPAAFGQLGDAAQEASKSFRAFGEATKHLEGTELE